MCTKGVRKIDHPFKHSGGERGFTLIGLLILITVMSVALATVSNVWYTMQKREKEQELLFVGNQFRHALARYFSHSTGQAKRHPMSLEDLTKDPRYPNTVRYLRKVYVDPMTGDNKWGLVKGPTGEIFGIYSLSEDEPIKKANFQREDRDFEGKKKYSEWIFMPTYGKGLRH